MASTRCLKCKANFRPNKYTPWSQKFCSVSCRGTYKRLAIFCPGCGRIRRIVRRSARHDYCPTCAISRKWKNTTNPPDRICSRCRARKPAKEFHVRGKNRRLKSMCKSCESDYYAPTWRLWYQQNRTRVLNKRIKRIYGISRRDFNKILRKQHGRCAICRTRRPGGNGTWHIDHNHKTGRVRGLLCARCNIMIAQSRESAANLVAAVKYMRRNGE